MHVSAGDLLRAEVLAGTEAGTRAESFMSQGFLVPNELVSRLPREICPASGRIIIWQGHLS